MRRAKGLRVALPAIVAAAPIAALAVAPAGCRWARPSAPEPPADVSPEPPADAPPDAPGELAPPPVRRAPEEVVVAAWAEPPRLPLGGGQVQVLVRAQKRDGQPFPGVEVRLRASDGSLYSRSQVLVTDARGMTRDRLTTRRSVTIVLNAGGTRYKFEVPVQQEGVEN